MKRTILSIALMLAGLAFGEVTRNTKWYEVPDETLVGTVVDLGQGGGGGGGGGCDTNAVRAIVSNTVDKTYLGGHGAVVNGTNSTLKIYEGGDTVFDFNTKVDYQSGGQTYTYQNGMHLFGYDGDTVLTLSYRDSHQPHWYSLGEIVFEAKYGNHNERIGFAVRTNNYVQCSYLVPDGTDVATKAVVADIALPTDYADTFYASATTTNINGCAFTIYSHTNWFYAVECKIGDRRSQSFFATGRVSDPFSDEGARYYTYISPSATDFRKLEFGWKLWGQDSHVQLGVYVYDCSTSSYIVGSDTTYVTIYADTHKPYSLYRCTQQSVEEYDLAYLKSKINPLATTNYVNTKAANLQTQLNNMAAHKANIFQIGTPAEMEADDRTWGDVVLYIGTTTSKYHYGYFYRMTAYQPNQWQAVAVMDMSGYVPTYRTINGQSLANDITIEGMSTNDVKSIVTENDGAWTTGRTHTDGGYTSLTNTAVRWNNGRWEVQVRGVYSIGGGEVEAVDGWYVGAVYNPDYWSPYMITNTDPNATMVTTLKGDFDGNVSEEIYASRTVTNALGLAYLSDLDAYAKRSEVTNIVNEVKEQFYDTPLSVNWTLKMVNGEMKLYATTNVDMSVAN